MKRITYIIVPYKTVRRLFGVARNPANGFPARLLGTPLHFQYRNGTTATVTTPYKDLTREYEAPFPKGKGLWCKRVNQGFKVTVARGIIGLSSDNASGPFVIQSLYLVGIRLYNRGVKSWAVEGEKATMGQLDVEIATYERLRDDLEANHRWEWAVVHGAELAGTFEDFQVAADTAVRRYGRGPYLIRQIGAPPIVIPSHIIERAFYANS